jgi:hypothetical protein
MRSTRKCVKKSIVIDSEEVSNDEDGSDFKESSNVDEESEEESEKMIEDESVDSDHEESDILDVSAREKRKPKKKRNGNKQAAKNVKKKKVQKNVTEAEENEEDEEYYEEVDVSTVTREVGCNNELAEAMLLFTVTSKNISVVANNLKFLLETAHQDLTWFNFLFTVIYIIILIIVKLICV